MSRKTTQQLAQEFLDTNAPHVKLLEWGGSGIVDSLFINNETGYKFKGRFNRIKHSIKTGGNPGGRATEAVEQEDIKKAINLYLANNAPHIKLIKAAEKISDRSVFINTETGREFVFSFSDLKYQINNGFDAGIGLSEAAKRANNKKKYNDREAREWLTNNAPHIKLIEWGGSDSSKSLFLCDLYGEFNAQLKNIKLTLSRGGVPYNQRSGLEIYIENWLLRNNIHFEQNVKIPDSNYRPDFLLPNHNLIIECDGLYWHSDSVIKDNDYHQKKKETYNSLGYISLFFREDEIKDKFAVVTSIISNKLGLNKRVFARKCTIQEIDPSFFETNHLMGKGAGKCFGLFDNGLAVAGIQVKWKNKKTRTLEISRFCTLNNTSVLGGFDKLVKYVEKEYNPNEVLTYIDLRYGKGDYLETLGFIQKETYLSFKWTKNGQTVHRMKFPGNTGYKNGFSKVWDCGQAKYLKGINK